MTWIRVDVGLWDHPKLAGVPTRDRLDFIGWFLGLVAWSANHLTDGQIPARMLLDASGRPCARSARAQRARMIHMLDDHCARCEGPQDPGGAVIHDFTDWQSTKAQVTATRAATRDRVNVFRAKGRNAVTEPLQTEVGQASVTQDRTRTKDEEHLLTLVSQLTSQQNKIKTSTSENSHLTWARWRDLAGDAVDLAAEADAWLDRCYTAGMPHDPAGAWLGWLREARNRATATQVLTDAATPKKAPGCNQCHGGWTGEDDAGRPIPCPTCRPNVIRMRYGTDHA